MDSIRIFLFTILNLAALVSGVTKIQTVSIHSPTSGATLNPVGAAINTKLQTKYYSNHYVYGQYSPYGGIGLGAGLAGYGPPAVGGYGGYGDVFGYQYGNPGLPGSYSVKAIYHTPNDAFHRQVGAYPVGAYPGSPYPAGAYPAGAYPSGSYPGGYINPGAYPNMGGFRRPYPGYGNAGVYGPQYGPNQLGNNQGFLSYDAINKLSGYGG